MFHALPAALLHAVRMVRLLYQLTVELSTYQHRSGRTYD